MKISIKALLLLALGAQAAYGLAPRVIYGEDNRVNVQDSKDADLVRLSESVAGMVPKRSLFKEGGRYTAIPMTLSESFKRRTGSYACEEERFKDEYILPVCTGFLVGKDTLVTAGHCVETKRDCSGNYWVFGYTNEASNFVDEIGISASNVYKCESIIETKLANGYDYAVIKLDREVEGRDPLEFRREGKAPKGTPIAVIGHPSGLPLKIADGATVGERKSDAFFFANLDTYGGNSGSPVFNHETLEVEGILVRGRQDYVRDAQKGCIRSNYVSNDIQEGEGVSEITSVPSLMKL